MIIVVKTEIKLVVYYLSIVSSIENYGEKGKQKLYARNLIY